MELREYLEKATAQGASDLFIVAGLPLTCKINGTMVHMSEERVMPEETERLIRDIYALVPNHSMEKVEKKGDDDFSFSIANLARFRASIYKQRGSLASDRLSAAGSGGAGDPGLHPESGGVPEGAGFGHRAGRKRKVHHAGLPH